MDTTINCYLLDLARVSRFDIGGRSATLLQLQTLIWTKYKNSSVLQGLTKRIINPSDLMLFRTSLSTEAHFAKTREKATEAIAGLDPLQPSEVLTFDCWNPGTIDIVVMIPGTARSSGPLYARMQSLYDKWWGEPLNIALTTLPATQDTNNTDHDKGDLLPGDPFLKVDNETTLFVRTEYIRVFDEIMTLSQQDYAHSMLAVVTGQTGIGKTWWIYYALRRCLGEQRPVAWYLPWGKCLWFTQLGVSIVECPPCEEGTWCFVDSADAPVTMDPNFCDYLMPLFPIYVTPPRESRWRKLHQTGRHPQVVTMNPWTWPEIEKAAQLYPVENNTIDDVRARFRQAGPIIRECLLSNSGVPENQRAPRHRMPLDAGSFRQLILDSQMLCMDDVSDTICLVRRSADPERGYTVEPITPDVRRQMRNALEQWGECELLNMLRRLFWGFCSKNGIAGVLFEVHFRRVFGRGIKLVAAPMTRAGGANSGWCAMLGGGSSAAPQLPSLDITPTEQRVYDPRLSIQEGVYYVPWNDSQAAVDSFIFSGGCFYLFRFACSALAAADGTEPGLQDVLGELSGPGVPDRSRWRFVFVVPSHLETFECAGWAGALCGDRGPYVAQVGEDEA